MSRYQILLSENGANGSAETLKSTILLRFQELGIDANAVAFFDDGTISSRDTKAPTVGAFLSTQANPASRGSISELIREGLMVVPVVRDLQPLPLVARRTIR